MRGNLDVTEDVVHCPREGRMEEGAVQGRVRRAKPCPGVNHGEFRSYSLREHEVMLTQYDSTPVHEGRAGTGGATTAR